VISAAARSWFRWEAQSWQGVPGIAETVAGSNTDLQPSEGVVVEVHADVFRLEGMHPLDFLEDLLGDVAVRDVALLGGAELDEVVDLPQVPGEQDIGG